jgi:eukaryotic-like serine/threonine-protein kinase
VNGRKLSHYEIIESLGIGGMGEVYRAHDSSLGREVAIKVLAPGRPLSDVARRRFKREAMAASQLNHPNIIIIHAIDTEGDTDFIVMEYVRGQTLHSLLKSGQLSIAQVLRCTVQMADALAKAHAAGIVHRDLKPSNIMVTEDGIVKILDFGLAKFDYAVHGETGDRESETVQRDGPVSVVGSVSGTLSYMSPEQARGDPVDARSDIFSFGIVLFQMLSGELPFAAPSQIALLHNLHFNPPKDLSRLRPRLPRELVALTSHMLEKDPAKRVHSMAEVAAEIRRIARAEQLSLSQDFTVEPNITQGHPRPRFRWRKWLAVPAGVILVVAIGFGIRELLRKRGPQSGPAQSQAEQPVVEDNPFALYRQAREDLEYFDRPGNDEKAIHLLDRAIQLDPTSAVSYAALTEAYYRKNQDNPDPQWVRLGSESAHRAMSLNNDLASSHVAMGIAQMQAARAAEAEKDFRAAADLDPRNAAPHRWLGVLFNKTNKGKQAVEELNLAIHLNPGDWKNYMELGLNAYRDADYKRAMENWEHALKIEPDNPSALFNLGAVYQLLDRNDDAAAALQHSLEIKPTADTYGNLGTLRFYQGRYRDSVTAFEKALELGANHYDNWANLADAYRWTPGYSAKAGQAYQRAIQLVKEEIAKNPQSSDLRSSLAMYLAKNEQKPEALLELKALESVPGKQAATLSAMAIAYELCGERDKALNSLQAAVKAGQSLADLKNEPDLASLRTDPRYHRIVMSASSSQTH